MGEHDRIDEGARETTVGRGEPARRRIVAATGRPERARAVFDAGIGVGRALDAPVHGLHVHEGATAGDREAVQAAAAATGVDVVEAREGGVVEAVAEAAAGEDVQLTVIAADGWDDEPTLESVSRGLLEAVSGPVLVVPRGCSPRAGTRPRRVLAPHDGTDETASAVDPVIAQLRDAGLEVVLLHVLDPEHVPPCIDHPRWGVESWGHEFLARHADVERDLVLCSGEAGQHVLDAVARRGADLVLLGWSQDLSRGHAAVVRELIDRATVPLLMVRVPEQTPRDVVSGVVPVSVGTA